MFLIGRYPGERITIKHEQLGVMEQGIGGGMEEILKRPGVHGIYTLTHIKQSI